MALPSPRDALDRLRREAAKENADPDRLVRFALLLKSKLGQTESFRRRIAAGGGTAVRVSHLSEPASAKPVSTPKVTWIGRGSPHAEVGPPGSGVSTPAAAPSDARTLASAAVASTDGFPQGLRRSSSRPHRFSGTSTLVTQQTVAGPGAEGRIAMVEAAVRRGRGGHAATAGGASATVSGRRGRAPAAKSRIRDAVAADKAAYRAGEASQRAFRASVAADRAAHHARVLMAQRGLSPSPPPPPLSDPGLASCPAAEGPPPLNVTPACVARAVAWTVPRGSTPPPVRRDAAGLQRGIPPDTPTDGAGSAAARLFASQGLQRLRHTGARAPGGTHSSPAPRDPAIGGAALPLADVLVRTEGGGRVRLAAVLPPQVRMLGQQQREQPSEGVTDSTLPERQDIAARSVSSSETPRVDYCSLQPSSAADVAGDTPVVAPPADAPTEPRCHAVTATTLQTPLPSSPPAAMPSELPPPAAAGAAAVAAAAAPLRPSPLQQSRPPRRTAPSARTGGSVTDGAAPPLPPLRDPVSESDELLAAQLPAAPPPSRPSAEPAGCSVPGAQPPTSALRRGRGRSASAGVRWADEEQSTQGSDGDLAGAAAGSSAPSVAPHALRGSGDEARSHSPLQQLLPWTNSADEAGDLSAAWRRAKAPARGRSSESVPFAPAEALTSATAGEAVRGGIAQQRLLPAPARRPPPPPPVARPTALVTAGVGAGQMSLQRAVLPPSRADRDLLGTAAAAALAWEAPGQGGSPADSSARLSSGAAVPRRPHRAPDSSMALADAVSRAVTEAEVLRDPAATAAEGLVQSFLSQFGRRLGEAERAFAEAQRASARVFGGADPVPGPGEPLGGSLREQY